MWGEDGKSTLSSLVTCVPFSGFPFLCFENLVTDVAPKGLSIPHCQQSVLIFLLVVKPAHVRYDCAHNYLCLWPILAFFFFASILCLECCFLSFYASHFDLYYVVRFLYVHLGYLKSFLRQGRESLKNIFIYNHSVLNDYLISLCLNILYFFCF